MNSRKLKNSDEKNFKANKLDDATENSSKIINSAANEIINLSKQAANKITHSSEQFDEVIKRYMKQIKKRSKTRRKIILITFSCSLVICLTLTGALLIVTH